MNDTIKRLAMEYKKACDTLNQTQACDAILLHKACVVQDSCARLLSNAVLDAIESEAQ